MKSMITKLLVLLLIACMLVPALVACKHDDDNTTPGTTTGGSDVPAADKYTYNGALSTFPTNWNPLRYSTSTDGDVYELLSNSFYEFAYNETYDGYKIVSVMAVGDPVDVSANYAGDDKIWGIATDETGRAFRITLNPDAQWEDGLAINADSYIESFKRLLDPDLMNSRASNYYQGSYAIHNAKEYLYSGQVAKEPITSSTDPSVYEGKTLYVDFNNAFGFKNIFGAGLSGLAGYAANYLTVGDLNFYEKYKDVGIVAITDEMKADLETIFSGDAPLASYWGGWEDGDWVYFCSYDKPYPVVSFSDVGVQKVDDYTIDIILDKALKGFYIKYTLGLPLVHIPTYDKLKKQNATTGAWSTTYGTSKDTTMSYGPYKMTVFMDDQEIRYTKNEKWFGYMEKYASVYGTYVDADGEVVPQYQTTDIVYKKASDISTREMMFNSGELASLGLNAALLDKYRNSSNIYFAPGAATYYGIINSDFAKLREAEIVLNGNETSKQYNKTILSIKEFRQALSYALNRTELCAALYPAGTAAFGLFSDLIMADPENSVSFRSLTEAKEGMCEYWGVEYGEGKEFATLDEAYAAITGYNITEAKRLINVAVDKAIAAGYMDANSIVRITYCAASSSDTETKWYNTFNTMFTELMVGTKLEGKFQYDSDFTLGNEFGTKIQAGACDTAWGFGWSGGELDPYDLVQVYVDGTTSDDPYQYDKWIDRSAEKMTLTLPADGRNGAATEMTYSLLDWYYIINGIDPDEKDLPDWAFGNADDSVRAKVLAALEKAILETYTTIPMMNQGAVQLRSFQINYGRDNYVFGMGFGGLRYITYNFTDAEWAAFVASHNLEEMYK